ncbi:MAG: 3,4-dihydroxy-2-butanone-4-phosphate synthase [Actinobacteria bacterium]|nr:3,4-dihydroxy-2-butanone-4-phosphate synthase [Actinomycetota bacterium]
MITPGLAETAAAMRAGRPIVLVDDIGRWGGGDLIFAAELATPELMAFAVRHTSGFVCVSLPEDDADRLELPLQAARHDGVRPAYTVSVDAKSDGTGISATHRSQTARLLAGLSTEVDALTRPGHIVPVRVRAGGVLAQPGRAEAAHDLALVAGLRPVCVHASIVSVIDSTLMADEQELNDFARQHSLSITSVSVIAKSTGRLARPVQGAGAGAHAEFRWPAVSRALFRRRSFTAQ